jgi:hypothetical protein
LAASERFKETALMLGVHEQDVDFAAKKLLASNTTAASVLDNRRLQVAFGFTEGFKKAGREEASQGRLL